MILNMSRVRILGPKTRLVSALHVIQDLGLVHVTRPAETERMQAFSLSAEQSRHASRLQRIAEDAAGALTELDTAEAKLARAVELIPLPRAALIARRTRRSLEALRRREQDLLEERALILKFSPFFSVFRRIGGSGLELDRIRIFYLILREGGERDLLRLRAALAEALGDGFQLIHQPAESDAAAMLLAVPATAGQRAEALLSQAGVQALPLPEKFGQEGAAATVQRMRKRLRDLPNELASIDRERLRIARDSGAALLRIQADCLDELATLSTMEQAAVTPRAFVLEGWVPSRAVQMLEQELQRVLGGQVELERLSKEEWAGEPTPVVLTNPRIFRPFEAITGMMPLPRYGTVDPTPFVAVFFPMFFGIALGDIGYGLLLAAVALGLRLRSKPDSKLRAISEIGLACSLFTLVFGFLYGELFGDLGHRVGLKPILFNREETVIPFLGLALALGLVHIVIGLLLGAVKMFRGDRRRAIGRGMAAVMVVLIAMTLMAAFELLPSRFFTPLVIAILVAFPILIVAEGFLAPIELVSTLGNILSYARIMAVGTASVMMAVAANRMAGAFGGVAVGVVFALLFHLVNFVIGVFSPTIHMLRLHYVEFFGKFFSPGGIEYRPFRHWSSRESAA